MSQHEMTDVGQANRKPQLRIQKGCHVHLLPIVRL
jgi:hypothetical protein